MKLEDILKKIEGSNSFLEVALDRYLKERKIIDMQLERFHNNCDDKVAFIKKVINKYNSKEYKDRWYKRGIEPMEDLYWFLYDYATIYGREANGKEYDEYAHMFTSNMFIIEEGYAFMRVDGQGSHIDVFKI